MKLVRYGEKGREKPGILDSDGTVRDLSRHIVDIAGEVLCPDGLEQLRGIDISGLPRVAGNPRLGVPVSGIGKIIGIARNYAEHAAETGSPLPSEPMVFGKWLSSLNGPNDPVEIPRDSKKTDWEVELGVVIGRRGKYIKEEDALAHIAGYCTVNDVSEREFQSERGGQMAKGKGCDTFAPIGPWLVTADEVPDPNNLRLWLEVDAQRRQDGTTAAMIFKVPFLISYLSRMMSLNPGDIICTGTPSGVGMGMKPPTFLRAGQTMRLEVEGLGQQCQQLIKG